MTHIGIHKSGEYKEEIIDSSWQNHRTSVLNSLRRITRVLTNFITFTYIFQTETMFTKIHNGVVLGTDFL